MTRKHYEKIAGALREYRKATIEEFGANTEWGATKLEVMEDISDILAGIFETENELFDRARFLSACVPNE